MTRDDKVARSAGRLRAILEESRAALLEVLRDLTERDFATPLDDSGSGETVVTFLASLAPLERRSIVPGAGVGGRDPREVTRDAGGPVLPPQVIHDLAGARFETLRRLERDLEDRGSTAEKADEALAGAELAQAIEAVATREREAAALVSARIEAARRNRANRA